MKQIDFYVKRKNTAFVHRLIRECDVKKVWHSRITKGNTYFLVQGSNKKMAQFNARIESYTVK
jgi:hypothetical protein